MCKLLNTLLAHKGSWSTGSNTSNNDKIIYSRSGNPILAGNPWRFQRFNLISWYLYISCPWESSPVSVYERQKDIQPKTQHSSEARSFWGCPAPVSQIFGAPRLWFHVLSYTTPNWGKCISLASKQDQNQAEFPFHLLCYWSDVVWENSETLGTFPCLCSLETIAFWRDSSPPTRCEMLGKQEHGLGEGSALRSVKFLELTAP